MTTPTSPLTWHLLGPGSMGTLAASRLQQAGHEVVLPAGRAQSRTLRLADGSETRLSWPVDEHGPIHALVVAVKAGDTEAALRPLLPRLQDNVLILRLQNGMGTLDGLPLPDAARVIHALTTDGAFRRDHVIQVVAQNATRAGDGQLSAPPALEVLASVWPGWQWCPDIELHQWQKLAINALINPLTALFRCRNGELLDDPQRRDRMRTLAEELDRAIPLWLPHWPGDSLANATAVAAQTAGNTSSMLADVLAGRETEIHFINGYLVRQASRMGLPLPAHQQLIQQVRAIRN